MGLYQGGLKSGVNFVLEPEWAYIRAGIYPGGPLFGILRYDKPNPKLQGMVWSNLMIQRES